MPELVLLINLLYRVITVLIIARVLLSWIPGFGFNHPAVRIIHQATAPLLDPIRRLMPPIGGLDMSPLVALMLLHLARNLLIDVLLAI